MIGANSGTETLVEMHVRSTRDPGLLMRRSDGQERAWRARKVPRIKSGECYVRWVLYLGGNYVMKVRSRIARERSDEGRVKDRKIARERSDEGRVKDRKRKKRESVSGIEI
ncbi:hypothetical protein TIFTF001_027201 [Ficus carica]|uniref:Uncharacterized protein n=1 Tax=Ficus carica TaxID=3494 RepID=A0AA88DMK7_FICCA|nr:hypothetical protein TIFTF001_027201 [Ficus carica]